jgi:hypothetical protein
MVLLERHRANSRPIRPIRLEVMNCFSFASETILPHALLRKRYPSCYLLFVPPKQVEREDSAKGAGEERTRGREEVQEQVEEQVEG